MPKYQSIAEELLKRITSGVYDEAGLIPDEFSLCQQFDCSRMTVKKALELLVLRGIIYRKRGHGTFVMKQGFTKERLNIDNRDLSGFSKIANGSVNSKILEFKIEFASAEVSSHLNIKLNDPVYSILRVRYVDNEPYTIERTYMPTLIILGLSHDVLKGSIYSYIENELRLTIASSYKKIKADKANDLDKKYLKLNADEPVLEIEQIAYLQNGITFEYSFSRHRYDKFEFISFAVSH